MKKGELRPDLYRAEIKICPTCGSQFRAVKDTKKRKQIYCSRDCFWEKRRNPIKEIQCKYCGKTFRDREGRKYYCSHLCYSKHLKIIKAGENSHFWEGGKTKQSKILRTNADYKEWRMAVFTRDNFTCKKCGSKRNLEAHHIKEQSNYPELRYVVSNGLTLCHSCHKQTGNYAYKAKQSLTSGCLE